MTLKSTSLDQYTYHLPDDKIAKHPLDKRESSKLLVYQNGQIEHRRFQEVVDLIPDHSTLFLNNTKVISARLYFYKKTGGKIEVFLTNPISPSTEFQQMLKAKNECTWQCIIGNLKKWKDEDLSIELDGLMLTARMLDREKGLVQFHWTGEAQFLEIIERAGHVPLPPYLNREDEADDKERYQTVFSEFEGAVAAPTAGLHFTHDILVQIEKKDVRIDKVTLHVSAGTFRPIKTEDFKDHDMHNERIIILRQNIHSILNAKGLRIAVGTTALRTLESIYWYGVQLCQNAAAEFKIHKDYPYQSQNQGYTLTQAMNAILTKMDLMETSQLNGETEIFIYPGYDFKIIDALSTNFHQPGSTLILLVAAFVGDDWKEIYRQALDKNYRFLSYGDTSLLFRG